MLRNKRSPIPSLIFIQRILTLLFTCTIEPETYGIAIRKEEKGRKKEKEREGKKKGKTERKGADLRFRFVPRSGDVERVHVTHQLFVILLA